ncbi:hypothetical protein T07_12456, partial [Trichinella nelsoni]
LQDLLPLHGKILRILPRLIIMQFLNHLNMSLRQIKITDLLLTTISHRMFQ